ncbi:hydroxyglutarate oxidase [Marinococcus halophilus]|uniref:Hydroxyglutarate oxidase n=1 Tax=Marinococcus halophilus TaxID=1371 RepID=A0A510Y9J8_MARHA|nr:L-2-hydroxyglutarate oxidase [Marinococcus halophilus]OZT79578.1 hydroxyglutarate oxidase [Marinococcus halophilus]GEK60066.1 hydroxyglutarate oxidase [Marinococcus halophilus]
MEDYIIIGGGIVGLSVAYELTKQHPHANVTVLEKEEKVAFHQTGHNSGVIHSGIYYTPGSLKARLAKQGNKSMRQFAEKHQIPIDICGKVIVATEEKELPHLENLYQRGLQNELDIEKLSKSELLEKEPHVRGIAGIYVPSTGIIDYSKVSNKLAELIEQQNGQIKYGTAVTAISENTDSVEINTNKEVYNGRYLINCAGLQSDRIAELAGYHLDLKIVPFRGEYYKFVEEKRDLVRNLIYPVPNPEFPFLGAHFTRMMDGNVDAGPNAVLGFKREGYKKRDINIKDLSEVLLYKGFWKLAKPYLKEGIGEMIRSVNKKKFVQNLQKLIPEVQEEDLIIGPRGVRAQALTKDGKMVDDFYIVSGKKSLHVCNAPSPAATASLEIGKNIVERIHVEEERKEKASVNV